MKEDFGELSDEVQDAMGKQLPDFFERKLGEDCICFIIKDGESIVAAATMLIVEKPSSPQYLTGRIGDVFSVYTEPDYRHKGYCTAIMKKLVSYAEEKKLDHVELNAAKDGYPVSRKGGAADKRSRYTGME